MGTREVLLLVVTRERRENALTSSGLWPGALASTPISSSNDKSYKAMSNFQSRSFLPTNYAKAKASSPFPELCICTWRVQGAGSRTVADADVVAAASRQAGSVNFGLGVLWPVSPTALQANDTVAHCSGITESLPLGSSVSLPL